MSIYKDSLEKLHWEYTHRTSITKFGRQASLLQLMVDSYEVSELFNDLYQTIQKGPVMIDDDDLDYLEWSHRGKWGRPYRGSIILRSNRSSILALEENEQYADTYANKMLNVFGERIDNIEVERYKPIIKSVISSKSVVTDGEFEFAISRNINQIRDTLLAIYNFKENKVWKDYDYALMYKNLYEEFERNEWETIRVKKSHVAWLKGLYTEPTREDFLERRREIIISLFNTGFLDKLRNTIKTIPVDDLGFREIDDKDLVPDINKTLKYYAAFKKLCPVDNGKISFDSYSVLGKYIHDARISNGLYTLFFHHVSLLTMVENELDYLEHPENRPQNDDEVMEAFVSVVKQIMYKAQDLNGTVIEYKDNRGNNLQFEYKVDGARFNQVIDYVIVNSPHMLKEYIGGRSKENALGVSCVAPFIGAILRTHIFSCKDLRYKDIEFAFQFVLGEKNEKGKKISYIQKMGIKNDLDEKSIFKSLESIEKSLPKE